MPNTRNPVFATRDAGEKWFDLAGQAWWMWAEALSVIGMRSTMIALERPGHDREMRRMVDEKVAAALSLSHRLATVPPLTPEQAAQLMLAVYAPRVSANRRRLAAGAVRRRKAA